MDGKNYIDFTKMQGAGNDFIIIDNHDEHLSKDKIISLAPELCDRHFGIGADGVISLQPPEKEEVDYTMFYRNANGSDAGMCGNGARCLALFVAENGFGNDLTFNVHDTIYRAEKIAENQIEISFPIRVEPKEVNVNNETVLQFHAGTEHIVLQLSSNELQDFKRLTEKGRALRQAPEFNPPGTNVNFIHPVSKNTLFLRTYEKGVEDLTLACGTGAIASALARHYLQNGSDGQQTMIVQTDGGTLQVDFNYNKDEKFHDKIKLKGEARFVYEGSYKI